MALSNAERQRRWRERLRAAGAEAGLLSKLNTAFAEGYAGAVQAFIADHPDDGRDWTPLRDVLLEPAPPAGEDFWLARARDEGEAMGRLVAGRVHAQIAAERPNQAAAVESKRTKPTTRSR